MLLSVYVKIKQKCDRLYLFTAIDTITALRTTSIGQQRAFEQPISDWEAEAIRAARSSYFDLHSGNLDLPNISLDKRIDKEIYAAISAILDKAEANESITYERDEDYEAPIFLQKQDILLYITENVTSEINDFDTSKLEYYLYLSDDGAFVSSAYDADHVFTATRDIDDHVNDEDMDGIYDSETMDDETFASMMFDLIRAVNKSGVFIVIE